MDSDRTTIREFIAQIEKLRRWCESQTHHCYCSQCTSNAIKSHVFQKKLILKPISNSSNKVYVFNYPHLFDCSHVEYKLKGINDSFFFKGFCPIHDNNIFSRIEPKDGIVDWSSNLSQYLLAYRTLCRELYQMEITITCLHAFLSFIREAEFDYVMKFSSMFSSLKYNYKNLLKYKSFVEKGVLQHRYENFMFRYHELPYQLDLCVALTISGTNPRGLNYNTDYQEVNIVNIFSYKGRTIISLGYSPLKEFSNYWLNKIDNLIASRIPENLDIALTDILLRSEFHCLSPTLYNEIGKDTIKSFLQLWYENKINYTMPVKYRLEMFSPIIKKLILNGNS